MRPAARSKTTAAEPETEQFARAVLPLTLCAAVRCVLLRIALAFRALLKTASKRTYSAGGRGDAARLARSTKKVLQATLYLDMLGSQIMLLA